MSKKSAKNERRVMKTKEELMAELKGNTKFIEKMKFTKEQFFPALVKSSHNVDDAKMFLSSISTILMEKFLGYMKEKKFSDLKLVEVLDPKDVKFEEYKELLALFDDMSIFDAKDLIEGMKNEIDLFITEEMKNRTLDTLPTRWLDEL